MKRRYSILTVIVAVIALAAVPFVYGQGFHHGHHGASAMGLGAHLGKLRQALNLTDAQVEQLKAIRQDLKTQNATLRQQRHSGFQAVAQTLIANPNDLTTAQAQLDQQLSLERTMKLNTLNAASKALNVLTPDQRAKLGQLLAERQARRQQK